MDAETYAWRRCRPGDRAAHGAIVRMTTMLPDAVAEKLMERAGIDRLHALYLAIDLVRRGGTISLIGVYGGMADPLPMLTLFDRQIQLRMGQANVKRWVDDIMPLLTDGDPLGVESFHTHQVPLEGAPEAYEMFQKKQDGVVKGALQAVAQASCPGSIRLARWNPSCALSSSASA
jgi:threonine dehydrogenase-like Zn-dependent dehydrogenase